MTKMNYIQYGNKKIAFKIERSKRRKTVGINIDPKADVAVYSPQSLEPDKIKENIKVAVDTVKRKRPADIKGEFMKSVVISTTMGPGVKLAEKD